MIYATTPLPPYYKQMSIEELLFGTYTGALVNSNKGNTRTFTMQRPNLKLLQSVDFARLFDVVSEFSRSVQHLREQPRASLYHSFDIPKKKGGLRHIDAPLPDLMQALRTLKGILENEFHALYHTSAFAYVKGRCTVDAVKRHQSNESRWFAKFDLSNFFGSTTLDFVMRQLETIFPFSEAMRNPAFKRELTAALELGFLNGGLPQGTPLSPTLTNIMMIPIDHALTKACREKQMVYTRYADDFLISSKYDFNFREVEQLIVETLSSFHAPFQLNRSKTRYGSSAGSNWNLGVMLNKDNEITIGRQKKRQFETMLVSFIRDNRAGIAWDPHDIQTVIGYYSYYTMVEPVAIPAIVSHINQKHGADVLNLLKQALN